MQKNPEKLNYTEFMALSVMRDIPDDQKQDAMKWFQGIAEKKQIRESVLEALKQYLTKSGQLGPSETADVVSDDSDATE